MIEPAFFFGELKKHGTRFFTGVPDSLLKNFCAYLSDNEDRHIISANEGNAIALAAGHHLATGKIPLVYMQNSGLGNAINPLLSLVDHDVYRIPLMLLIGWRGEPGVKDEAQHITQGRLTRPLLETMEIPTLVMAEDHESLQKQLETAYRSISETGRPFALVVKKNCFAPYSRQKSLPQSFELTREAVIEKVMLKSKPFDIVVSTTGMASRELYELREKHNLTHEKDFLTVGSMGHASQIALGIALEKKDRRVLCIDGDGAVLMQMGGLALIGTQKPVNFLHIILNNGAHDSVGGQPTVAFSIDLVKIALACGYTSAIQVQSPASLETELTKDLEGPRLIEIRINKGARQNLGRPKESPQDNKIAFMQFVSK